MGEKSLDLLRQFESGIDRSVSSEFSWPGWLWLRAMLPTRAERSNRLPNVHEHFPSVCPTWQPPRCWRCCSWGALMLIGSPRPTIYR